MKQHLAPVKILFVNVWAHAIHCHALFFTMVLVEPIHFDAGDSVTEGYRPDLLQDVSDQRDHMHESGTHFSLDSINPEQCGTLDTIDGKPMEFEWNISKNSPHCSSATKSNS